MIADEKIEKGVINLFKKNMRVKAGEKIIVLTDTPTAKEWIDYSRDQLNDALRRSFLAKAVSYLGKKRFPDCQVVFFTYPSIGKHGTYPGKDVEDNMKNSDVAIAITTYSLSHTDARTEACKAGTRVASMPTFLPDMFYPGGPMAADYTVIADDTERIADYLEEADMAQVRSKAGTDISLSVNGRPGLSDTGIMAEKGAWGNLPAGEAYVIPVEGTAEGMIVVEKGWCEGLKEIMKFKVKAGNVYEVIGGGSIGDRIRSLLSFDKNEEPYTLRRNIGELGVGTNPNAKRPDNLLEGEKIKGTVHLALGDNSHMGGNVRTDLHWDFVIPKADLILDDKHIMKNGRLMII